MDKILCHSVISGEDVINFIDNYDPFGDGSGMALYKLDGDATDERGLYNGTASGVGYETGHLNIAGVFLEDADTIDVATNINTSSFSYSAWVKIAYTTDKNPAGIISGIDQTDYSGASLSYLTYGLTNTIQIQFQNHGGSGGTNPVISHNVSSSSLNGVWAHLVCTASATETKLYLNGANVASGVPPDTHKTITSLAIGQYFINYDYYRYNFEGRIDQVRIFNRALTSTETAILYNEEI